MKRIKLKISVIFLLLTLGCTEGFLREEHPTQETVDNFFKEDADVQEAANSLYENLTKQYGAHLNDYMAGFDMLRGDNITLPKKFNNNSVVKWLTLNYNPEDGKVRDAWSHNYERIYRANWVISHVTDNPNISDNVRKKALSEAYFLRGYSYFNLVRYFKSAPLMLKKTTAENYYPENATEEELWNQVFSDYQKALDEGGLPEPAKNFMDGRINTGVVNAMMARAYLYQTRPESNKYWDKVKQFTEAVENLNVYELESIKEFSSLFVYTEENKWVKNSEVIWGAGFIYGPIFGGTPFMYINRSFIGVSTMPVGYATTVMHNDSGDPYLIANGRTGRARYAISTDLSEIMIGYYNKGDKRATEFLYYPTFGSYELSDPDDNTSVQKVEDVDADSLYQKIVQTNGAEGEYIHIKKFQLSEFVGTNIWDGGWNHSLVYPIIRYSDVLLMRAEAEYHLGNEMEAKDYLKQVTDRAGFNQNYVTQFSGQVLLDEILKQRRVELMFESLRVPDLIRLNKFEPPQIGTYPGSVAFDEKLKILPIPRRELDLNQNLEQNELWR